MSRYLVASLGLSFAVLSVLFVSSGSAWIFASQGSGQRPVSELNSSPILVNFTYSAGGKVCIPLSSGLMPFSENWQIEGVIANTSFQGHAIEDITLWFEKDDGTKVPNATNPSPIEKLDIKDGATTWQSASSVSNNNGLHRFNMPAGESIGGNSSKSFRLRAC